MNQKTNQIPERLREIVAEFEYGEGPEKVEMLLAYSERMPALPDRLKDGRDTMDLVEECMTPVYVTAEVIDGHMTFYFDVPAESPTVRGFAAIMAEGLSGTTPREMLTVPGDFFYAMGLEKVLTMQRLNGIAAILAHMKRLAAKALDG